MDSPFESVAAHSLVAFEANYLCQLTHADVWEWCVEIAKVLA